jgi:hypothetical protein
VAVGAVFVKTIAAQLAATVRAEIKMRFAEILFARKT